MHANNGEDKALQHTLILTFKNLGLLLPDGLYVMYFQKNVITIFTMAFNLWFLESNT